MNWKSWKNNYPNTQLFSSGVFRLPERLHWKACQTKCTMIVWDKKNSTHFNTEKCGAEYCLLFKTSSLGCCGVLVITIAQKAWTQALCRFKSCSRRVGDSGWGGSLTMIKTGNKTINVFRRSTIPQELFTIVIFIITESGFVTNCQLVWILWQNMSKYTRLNPELSFFYLLRITGKTWVSLFLKICFIQKNTLIQEKWLRVCILINSDILV